MRSVRAIVAAGVLGVAFGAGVAHADTDPADQKFAAAVQQLGINFAPTVDLADVGHGVCNQLTSGLASNVNPVPVVRGVVGSLTSSGMTRAQAGGLLRAAVAVYCPQHANVVGR